MMDTTTRVWVWVQNNELYKAVYKSNDRTLVVSNERDDVILQYKGISLELLARLEALFVQLGAKNLNDRNEPFTYL
jgi:hypothetical protein